MNKERGQFYTNFIEENSCDQKKLFLASKRLFNQYQDDGLPPNFHAPTFVRDIGKYFVAKIDTIQKQLKVIVLWITLCSRQLLLLGRVCSIVIYL